MKKILLSIIISSILLANEIIVSNDIYTKEGSAYFLSTDKPVSGIVSSAVNGQTIYTTYENGKKIKEKVLNNSRELVSEYSINEINLINGNVNFTNEYEENILAEVKNGIINGKAKQTYYGQLDFEGDFSYGVAHGKLKIIDSNSILQDKIYSNGKISNKVENFIFKDYFSKEITTNSKISFNVNGKAQKNSKPFTGLILNNNEAGYASSGTFYNSGEKTADFTFIDGFMAVAKVYKGINSFIQYDFLADIEKGILSEITNYKNNKPDGSSTVYYLNSERMEATYVNGRLFGKAITYDKNNQIIKVDEYTNDSFTSTTYYDYNKKTKKSEVSGVYNQYGEKIKKGKEIFYDLNQTVEGEINYDNSTYIKKLFYPNGKIKSEGEVDFWGQYYIGNVTEYYENGAIKTKASYTEGVLDGKKYYYDENSVEVKVENYNYGLQE